MDGDGELISSPSAIKERKTYSETFKELCPYFMAAGMSYDEYWNRDVNLVKVYWEAYRIRRRWESETANYEAWRQGLYFYSALCNASGAFNFFGKERKADAYLSEPLKFKYEDEEEKTVDENQQALENGLAYFKVLVDNINARRKKEGENNGGAG